MITLYSASYPARGSAEDAAEQMWERGVDVRGVCTDGVLWYIRLGGKFND